MKIEGYYRIAENQCDFDVTDRYLIVNCTGVYSHDRHFSNRSLRGRQDCYLMYLYRGSLDIEVAGTSHTLREGEAVLYPAKQPYCYTKADDKEMEYFWVHFSGYGVDEFLGSFGLSQGDIFTPGKSDGIAARFQRLFQCFYTREAYFNEEAAARLTDIFIRMSRRVVKNTSSGSAPLFAIQHSLEYIYRNYAKDIRLEQLAKMEHLSPSRYAALFKECMGISPQYFLISLRMENAADLLRRTDFNIRQVALAVGYEDALYFSGLFKKKMGMPPSEYRRQWIDN